MITSKLTTLALLLAAATASQAQCRVAAGFSPEGSASDLVLATIASARQSIRLAGYSFTAPDVVRTLVAAKRRGVDVRVVVDAKGNSGSASVAALNLLAGAGIPTRTISTYAIHHDKYMVVDGATVQTGSFNYTKAAQSRNSENVVVLKDCASIAQRYTAQWQTRWNLGADWRMTY